MAESSTILRGKVESNQANKKIKFIVGGAVVLGLIVYLIASAISSSGAYYREVSEVLNEKAALTGKSLRVSGNIVTESVKYDRGDSRSELQHLRSEGCQQAIGDSLPRRQARSDGARRIERHRGRLAGPGRRRRGQQPAAQVPIAL